MSQVAKMVRQGGRMVWRCPCCDCTLGEVYGDHVTVRTGDRLILFPLGANVRQVCPKCGSTSTATERKGVA